MTLPTTMTGQKTSIEFNDGIVRQFMLASILMPVSSLITFAIVAGGMKNWLGR